MLTKIERMQYKDALEHTLRLKHYYPIANEILTIIDEYGLYYEHIDERTIKPVLEKYKKSNWIFAVLEEFVTIDIKYTTKFNHKFFDHFYIKSFDIPKPIRKKIHEEYQQIVQLDNMMRGR